MTRDNEGECKRCSHLRTCYKVIATLAYVVSNVPILPSVCRRAVQYYTDKTALQYQLRRMEIGVLIVAAVVIGFLVLLGLVHFCKSTGCLRHGTGPQVVLDKVSIVEEEETSLEEEETTSDGGTAMGEEDNNPEKTCATEVSDTDAEADMLGGDVDVGGIHHEGDNDDDDDADGDGYNGKHNNGVYDESIPLDWTPSTGGGRGYHCADSLSEEMDLCLDIDGTREEIIYAPEGSPEDRVLVMEEDEDDDDDDEYSSEMKESLL